MFDDLDYENKSSKIYGVVTAIVTNNKDPDKMGRVKVSYPWLAEDDESYWARIATMMAGNNMGIYFIPEIDDEVLVAFEHGDINYPYIIGSLWNGKDLAPRNNDDGENNIRIIHTRSGHKVIFNDKENKESIIIKDKSGDRGIVIDTSGESISINDIKGEISISAKKKINIISEGDIEINASNKLDIKAQNISINAGGSLDMSSSSSTKIKAGSSMNIKANASSTIEAGASMKIKGAMTTVEASGITTVKGSLVKLN